MGFENSAGINARNYYGPREIESKFGGEHTSSGLSKTVEWIFDYNDLPDNNSTGEMEVLIPAYAYIKSASIDVITAMTGTSGTLTVGLQQADGTEIDNDGIDAAVAQAALTIGNTIVCDGALVGADIGAAAGQLVATTGGTVTGGRFRVLIEYVDHKDDGSGRYTAGGTKA